MATRIELTQENGKVKVGDIEYGEKFTDAPGNLTKETSALALHLIARKVTV